MSLPINIDGLLNGKTVEWERIEFKTGWNPLVCIQTICAFANDINNWGGGYVVIGVTETNGKPELPPVGISDRAVDNIQKELMNLCHQMKPNYFPIAEPVTFQMHSSISRTMSSRNGYVRSLEKQKPSVFITTPMSQLKRLYPILSIIEVTLTLSLVATLASTVYHFASEGLPFSFRFFSVRRIVLFFSLFCNSLLN